MFVSNLVLAILLLTKDEGREGKQELRCSARFKSARSHKLANPDVVGINKFSTYVIDGILWENITIPTSVPRSNRDLLEAVGWTIQRSC